MVLGPKGGLPCWVPGGGVPRSGPLMPPLVNMPTPKLAKRKCSAATHHQNKGFKQGCLGLNSCATIRPFHAVLNKM